MFQWRPEAGTQDNQEQDHISRTTDIDSQAPAILAQLFKASLAERVRQVSFR